MKNLILFLIAASLLVGCSSAAPEEGAKVQEGDYAAEPKSTKGQ